ELLGGWRLPSVVKTKDKRQRWTDSPDILKVELRRPQLCIRLQQFSEWKRFQFAVANCEYADVVDDPSRRSEETVPVPNVRCGKAIRSDSRPASRWAACRRDCDRAQVGIDLCNQCSQRPQHFVITKVPSRQISNVAAELKRVCRPHPRHIGVPLEVLVVVNLFASHLRIDVDRL